MSVIFFGLDDGEGEGVLPGFEHDETEYSVSIIEKRGCILLQVGTTDIDDGRRTFCVDVTSQSAAFRDAISEARKRIGLSPHGTETS